MPNVPFQQHTLMVAGSDQRGSGVTPDAPVPGLCFFYLLNSAATQNANSTSFCLGSFLPSVFLVQSIQQLRSSKAHFRGLGWLRLHCEDKRRNEAGYRVDEDRVVQIQVWRLSVHRKVVPCANMRGYGARIADPDSQQDQAKRIVRK